MPSVRPGADKSAAAAFLALLGCAGVNHLPHQIVAGPTRSVGLRLFLNTVGRIAPGLRCVRCDSVGRHPCPPRGIGHDR
jgi:hypothetical protein